MNHALTVEKLSLESVTKDLSDIFQNETIRNRPACVDEYFETMMKNDEISGKIVAIDKYSGLSKIIKEEILPLYDTYAKKKEEIEAKKEKMSIWKYMGGTVLFLELLGGVLSEGRLLMPADLLITIPIEAGLGALVYKATKWSKEIGIKNAESKFFNSVKHMDKKYLTDKNYLTYQEIMDGDLFKAETFTLLSKYSRPEEFWRDYKFVVSSDPISEKQFAKMKVENFSGFLQMHVVGAYNDVKRRERFDALFVEAHKYFVNKDRDYIKKQLDQI